MATELKRGLARIGSNYGRLVLGVILGLIVVRLWLRTLGDDGFALVALLGQTIGFAAMFQDIVRDCMIRELSGAYHDKDPGRFRPVFSSAVVLCFFIALLAMGVYVALYMLVPFFSIPEPLQDAARWFIVAKAVESFFLTLTAPHFNMYMVSERMVAYNLWLLTERICVTAAAAALLFIDDLTAANGVIWYGVLSTIMWTTCMFGAVAWMIKLDRRLIPSFKLVNRRDLKEIISIGVWQGAVVTSNNLHLRLDAIIMNLAFGLTGNRLFGLAVQLASYVRVIAGGASRGLEAPAARLHAAGDHAVVQRFVQDSTRVAAMFALPAGLVIGLLAEPALWVWVGSRLNNPVEEIPKVAFLVRILALGVVCWGVGDTWVRILYGIGMVRRYAPLLIINGIANPLLALLLLWLLPDSVRIGGPALAFTTTFLLLYLIGVSMVGARLLKMPISAMYRPMLGPLVATLLCSPVLIAPIYFLDRWTVLPLFAVLAGYGLIYAAVSWRLALSAAERQRFGSALARRFPGRKLKP